MKPEEQRIAIAEACGWVLFRDKPSGLHNPIGIDPSDGLMEHIPDYLNDLNAMHEAWLTISPYQKDRFESELHSVVIGLAEFNRNDDAGWITNATATQRAEAFLKTLNLWKDDN